MSVHTWFALPSEALGEQVLNSKSDVQHIFSFAAILNDRSYFCAFSWDTDVFHICASPLPASEATPTPSRKSRSVHCDQDLKHGPIGVYL